jgi:GNAT superfamily N-acetyltransferase
MDATIRPFRPADYVAVAGVISAACPDQSWTAEQLEHADKHRDLRCLIRRWVAEVGDQVVGTALYDQVASMYNPRKFVLRGAVRPEIQGQGIGSALYEIVTTALVPLDPISLLVQDVREDQVRGITLLEHRSFRKVLSAWESRLDVTSFDPGPFARVVDRSAANSQAL